MIVWKDTGKYLEGFIAGYSLYVVCDDGKFAYAQGATLKAMSIKVKSVEEAKALCESNATEFVKAVKEEL